MKKFYFDYAASTPVAPEVERAMRPYFLEKFGNAGSLHSFGQEASSALDFSRETIARAINADFREIIFTGSATEANNLAIRGLTQTVRRHTQKKVGVSQREVSVRPRVIVSAIEHESVLETARDLERGGVEVVYLPVDRNGVVNLNALKSALNEQTILVSVMYANNEIGTIQPITEISEVVRNFRNSKLQNPNNKKISNSNSQNSKHWNLEFDAWNLPAVYPLVHTDAVQAFQFLDCDVNRLGADLMTLSAHKIYGPKGVGALYIRNPKSQILNSKQIPNPKFKTQNVSDFGFRVSSLQQLVSSIVVGGNQEFGMRSGTENIPLIVGFAKAVELLSSHSRERENKRISELRDYFWKELKKICPAAEINGPGLVYKNARSQECASLPNILNIYFPDYKAEYLLAKFDLAGIAVSAGSACSARSAKPSYVIRALGYSDRRAERSVRFSFGRTTRRKEIDSALKIIRKLLKP